MRRALWGLVAVAALWACGGNTFSTGGGGGADGGSSSGGSSGGSSGAGSSSGGSSSGSGSSSGASSSSSGSGSSSGASSSSGSGSSSGSSSGGRVPTNHRPSDAQCLQQAPAGNCHVSGGSSGAGITCSADGDCTDAGPEGRCIQSNGGTAYCSCTWDKCADDTACNPGQTCACHGSPYTFDEGNHCVPGNCRVDADCGSGGYCSPSHGANNCGAVSGYYCHTSKDQCVNDGDCASGTPSVCSYDTSVGYWRCVMQVLCG